jgi:uncharacterized integral membrane protein
MKTQHIIIIILAVLALIIALQNTEVVTFSLFFWTISMSRILMMACFLLVGVFVGLLIKRR